VLYCPLLFMIGIWLALNWIYTGDSLAFLKDPASPFLGARISSEYLPWRAGFGTQFWSSTAISAMLLAICYPVLLLVQLPSVRRSRIYAAGLALAAMPVFASGLATWAEFTQSPADILVFVIGGVMALLTTGMLMRDHPLLLVLLLAVGCVGSLALFERYPAVGMSGWFEALTGRLEHSPREGDLELGESTGYAVIGARGTGEGLYLTFSDRFKQGVNSGRLLAEWVAVPSPLRDAIHRDQVAHNFPHLYDEGSTGYTLAYDRDGWRVYASEDTWNGVMHERARQKDLPDEPKPAAN
jgi:hypothetical protein